MDSETVHKNDIRVENPENGRFEGLRFYAHKSGTDTEVETHNTINNEDLATAFAQRVTRFCASANEDFTLSCDGIVRWIGQAVAQLTSTDNILKPKLILLADAQLTGEARDKVVARLERFVTFHFETTLKPLFDLRNADTLSGPMQTLALQLVDNLGILPRRKVAETVKNLGQESRAVLRQLGVRFGAFHIYLTGVLKPTAAQTITLLWSLHKEERDQIGLSEILAALTAGRTSLIIDPTYNPQIYHLVGYQILGRRAVRIDILERLANLIRPALHWKPGIEPKPEGAYDGKSFFVTPTMMSILGANSADMEEILKGLGYQSQQKSSAELQKELTHKESFASDVITKENYPLAEFVGNQWQDILASETTQEEKKASSSSACIEQPSCSKDHLSAAEPDLPAAEPVGAFAHQNCLAAEDKVVLLWRYNYQHNRLYSNRAKSEQKRQNKHRKTFKKEANPNKAPFKKEASQTTSTHKYTKTSTQYAKNKPSQTRKHPDPDSPFAKLAALRDQLQSDKDVHIIPFKGH
ncbi:hypothetical protein [Bartonella schoenbuchensis]|uniref:ATP-dependent helicase n=1 Tax=Bartonella schoenbuchensis m07a TaxID=1094496 RepID=N6VBL7_9HYPH|nr:hypothetical protein [Bartonella schoenbuchensis]ENN90661.1 ATP-dependent helicase [Bartonella schoenbuchensis m07a]